MISKKQISVLVAILLITATQHVLSKMSLQVLDQRNLTYDKSSGMVRADTRIDSINLEAYGLKYPFTLEQMRNAIAKHFNTDNFWIGNRLGGKKYEKNQEKDTIIKNEYGLSILDIEIEPTKLELENFRNSIPKN